MNPNEPAIQQFPTVRFRNKEYPITLKVGQLLRLKQLGLNLLEQPPADPHAILHHEAQLAYMQAIADNKPEEELAPLRAKVDEEYALISDARKNYRGPLDKTDPLEITEIALKIVAEAIRPHHPKIDYMDLADDMDVTEAVSVVTKAFDVAKNLFAVRAGQTQTAG